MAYRGYKYRLYPNAEQRAYFARCFGATRYCYNYCVREYDAACAAGVQLSGFDIGSRLREHLQDVKWMADVDYEIKESAPHRFDIALMKFKRHEANRPHEHKKGERPTVSYTTGGAVRVDFKHDLVQLPKIGILRARLHRSFSGEIVSATIKREADGNYYISLNVNVGETAAPKKPHTAEGTVGVDVGLHHLASLSTGDFKDMPDTSRSESRIQFLKKRLSLEKPGSRRYKRTAIQIARLHHHLANITNDRHCKIAAELCAGFDTICMETLAVQGMKRGQRERRGQLTVTVPTAPGDIAFNSQLHRAALASLKDRVERKAADTGTNFVAIDRFEPSTKTCHVCGHVLDSIDLDTREWTCPECGTHHDRDINAAINIRRKGIELLQTRKPASRQIDKLPLAEGNVKPAKETATGCDLRTGKGTTRYSRPPKAQIAGGTAPPRIFKKPRVEKNPCFEIPVEMKYFKISPVADLAGVTVHQFKTWQKQLTYGEIPEEMKEMHDHILSAIKQVAESLRHSKLKYDRDRAKSYETLGKMNKMVRADWLIAEVMPVEPNFTTWRSKRRKSEEIQAINKVVTRQYPDRLDDMLTRLKAFAYAPTAQQEEKPYADISEGFVLKKLHIFYYFKFSRIARKTGATTYAVSKWSDFKYKYEEKMFSYDDILRFLQYLRELASQLRCLEITGTSQKSINRQLKELEKDLLVCNILWDAGFYSAAVYDGAKDLKGWKREREVYYIWRAADKTKEDIQKLNQVICYELPELIDRFVAEEQPALEWEMKSVARQKC